MIKIMKNLFYILVGLLFFSCENYTESERIEKVPYITNLTTPITNRESKQRVLLEDYTGWKCVNCPRAAAKAKELISKYNTSLVVMAVHSTSFATPNAMNNNVDFRTEYGEKWAKDFGCNALPTGLINRIKFGSIYTVGDGSWDSEIQNQLSSLEHVMDIHLGRDYREEENNIILSVEAEFLQGIAYPTNISVVMVESGIIGVQLNSLSEYGPTPKIDDFEFEHVLRKKGIIDYPLSSESISSGTKIAKNYLLEIDNDIQNISKCSIIVFVSNALTNQIINVNEIHL